MARLMVTGASGLLGCTLVPRLSQAGWDVVTLSGSESAGERVDMTDAEAVCRSLKRIRPNAVVHLVGATNVDQCERDPQFGYALNVQCVGNLVEAARSTGQSPHLVHLSSDHVYDGVGPQAEDDVVIRNQYAMSKLAGEFAARLAVSAAMEVTVLRVNFVGRSQAPQRVSFSDWIVNALRHDEPLGLFHDVHFSPLRMASLAGAIQHVLLNPHSGVYNLGARGSISKADFAFSLARVLGLSPARFSRLSIDDAQGQQLARRPHGMAMNSERFERIFRYPLPSIEAEIAALREEYQD